MWDFIHRYEWKMDFSKEGYDLSLNFVKGICILFVLIHHTTDLTFHQESWFYIWGYPAVPLFLLIQVFHSYKKGLEKKSIRLKKICKRAILPFLIAELIIFICYIILNPSYSWRLKLIQAFFWGGKGPGSYYPWIYIQFAFLLPLLRPLFRRFKGIQLAVIFLLLSIGSELICSLFHMPEWIYRLLFIRYFFLIYLGYEMVKKGVVLNIVTISLSLISLITIYFFEVRDVDWSPWFYHTEGWKTFHWICYFYISYPMLYILCKLFYWLPPKSEIENIMCALGSHSYAIYLFQLFYFVNLSGFVKTQLILLGNPTLETFFYILFAIVICTIPVILFVKDISNRTILKRVLLLAFSVAGIVLFIGWKWHPFYMPPTPIKPFPVTHHHDDTLRVIMIGDSWVYFHETLRRDSTFEDELKRVLRSRKVKVVAKGKGGATSGEIYQRMSAERMLATEYDLNNCTQSIIEQGADYCVISAGINDARQRRGKFYYVNNYLRIVRLLLSYGIRPVIMEIPNVEIDEAFSGNTLYYRLKARICMSLLNTKLYGVEDYRNTLKDSLLTTHLMDSVIYVSATSWNPDGWKDKRDIYVDDHFHLNLPGYAILDSTFAAEIVKDYRLRKKK